MFKYSFGFENYLLVTAFLSVTRSQPLTQLNALGFNEISKRGINMCMVKSLQDGSLNPIPAYETRSFTSVFEEACYCTLPRARRFWPPIPPESLVIVFPILKK